MLTLFTFGARLFSLWCALLTKWRIWAHFITFTWSAGATIRGWHLNFSATLGTHERGRLVVTAVLLAFVLLHLGFRPMRRHTSHTHTPYYNKGRQNETHYA